MDNLDHETRERVTRLLRALRYPRNATAPTDDEMDQLHALVVLACERGYRDSELLEEFDRDMHTARYAGRVWLARARKLLDRQPSFPRADVPAVGPVCGECDARENHDPISARVIWLDTHRTSWEWCPRCHPRGVPAAADVQEPSPKIDSSPLAAP